MEKKSKGVAAVLSFFLGWIGAHRFYLGYMNRGIMMLVIGGVAYALTNTRFGFFGYIIGIGAWFWGLYDFISILLNKLKTSKGEKLE
jgi:TM2 domain-containing membrane protein YozV